MAAVAVAPAAPTTVLRAVAGLPPPDLTLPALAPAQSREQYRQRAADETEEAQWYGDEPDCLVEPQQVRLKSMHSKQASQIVFSNKSPFAVRALWLDFEGHEVVYSTLEPNTTKRYHTYATHPWIVREVQSGTRMMLSRRMAVVGLSTEQTVEVQAPPELTWSLDTHCCFPEPFKREVKALLLCHKRLEPYAAQGPANSNTVAARSIFASPTKRSALSPTPALSIRTSSPCSPCSTTGAKPDRLPFLPSACPVSPRGSLTGRIANQSCAGLPAAMPLSPSRRLNMAALPPAGTAAYSSGSSIAGSSGCILPVLPRNASPAVEAGMTSTTSISISSEAAHFTATLTVSSPKRAVGSSRVNIEVLTGGNTTVNIGLGENCASGHHGMSPAGSKKSGFLSMFKNMLQPKHSGGKAASAGPSTTFKLEVQIPHEADLLAAEEAEDDCCWPPMDTHLGHLPSHLLLLIAELARPTAWQTLAQPAKGRPDITPTILACAPMTPEQEQQEQQAAEDNQDQAPALA